jgi:predicted SAM-dependent methyltransferase
LKCIYIRGINDKQSVDIMKYLNLGCGSHYSTATEWTNLDFTSLDNNVIAHNLLTGIPFEDNSFDLVYHSHVLEHFSKEDGEKRLLNLDNQLAVKNL